MSSFLDLAAQRYSVRSFEPREVEPETLQKVLEAGRLAPTAKDATPADNHSVRGPIESFLL